MVREIIVQLLSARQRRFVAIAKDEATPGGYVRYAPISRGPCVNGLLILGIILAAPLYMLWRLLLRFLEFIAMH